MRNWDFTIELDPAREQPLFLQLANAVEAGIRCGRLKPGDALPGTRELADFLNVNRNTVVSAYGELAAEGLVTSRRGGGTFVAPALAAPARPKLPAPALPTYPLPAKVIPPPPYDFPASGALLLRGVPDARLLPARELARAFRRAISARGNRMLTCGDPRGHIRLRTELAAMLGRTRGLPVTPGDVLITRSIEQGLDLITRTLIAPGDAVVVESLSYPPTRSVLQLAGARLLPVEVDAEGLDVDALEALLEHEPVRAVLLTPHHQFPTTAVMSPLRRARLAALAMQHRFAIVEDDYDYEYHYDGQPVLPIAAGPARANVVYVGGLVDILAPSLGTAFITAPPPVLERLVALRAASDAQGDAAVDCAIAELFEDGDMLRHVRRMRRHYRDRRDALATALVRHLGSAVSFRVPDGSLGIWVRADEGIDVDAWSLAAPHEGVWFASGKTYDIHQRALPYMRLGFSYLDPAELDEAARRMARALMRARVVQSVPRGKAVPRTRHPEEKQALEADATRPLRARPLLHRVR